MTTTKTDYTAFARPAADGRIWWTLEDALKLGAGYLPMRDDTRNLTPRLIAPSQRVKANERDLLAAFQKNHFNLAVPRTVGDDGSNDAPLVDAALFLNWLSQYIAHSQADIGIPAELVRAVRDAEEEHMDTVEDSRADQEEYSRAWDLWVELDTVRAEIAEYEKLHPQTITEKAHKEDRLLELQERERTLEAQLLSESDHGDQSKASTSAERPQGQHAWQENLILQAIRELGHDPSALPEFTPGKPWVKSEVRAHVSRQFPQFAEGTVFQKAWERLRGDGRISEA